MTPDELLAQLGSIPQGPLLVALSGGADSVLAAWVAAAVAPGRARALHIHHGTAAADDMAAGAALAADALGLQLETVAVDVGGGASWEARARGARWGALFAKAEPGETIVTGHHEDDLAETVLGNLLRGAGAAGLAAFAADRPEIWRPLLSVGRSEVRNLATTLDLPFVDDPSNSDPAFTRNRLRHRVLPALEEESPDVAKMLARSARVLAGDDALLESLAAVPIRQDAFGGVAVPASVILTAPPPVAARIGRHLLRTANPPYAGSAADVATVLSVASGAVAAGEVSGGLRVELEGPLLVAHRGPVAAPDAVSLAVPGSVNFGRRQVLAVASPAVLVRRTALIDATAVDGRVIIRAVAAGERIEIAAGSKLIRDVLAEAEIAPRLRPAWPVAEANGRIAAVAGIRSAPWARGGLGGEGTFELKVRERPL